LVVEDEQAEVEPIVVSANGRGRGVGRRLLERVIDEAKKLGISCLSVKPVARNEEAVAFFYEAGFRILGHIQLFMWLGSSFPGQWRRGPVLFGKQLDH
jgi:N-acetylglutamate synthase-like GNAT family acetyltransferase